MSEHEMSPKKNQKHYVRAAYAPDGSTALSMTALLNEHGIDAYRQGGVKDIYKIGGDVFGEEIMVDPENLSRAQELLQQIGVNQPQPVQKPVSVRRTVLILLAAFFLFIILLLLRGRFMS